MGSTSVIEEFVASPPTEDSTTRAIRSIALLRSEAMLHAPGTFERVGGLMKVVRARPSLIDSSVGHPRIEEWLLKRGQRSCSWGLDSGRPCADVPVRCTHRVERATLGGRHSERAGLCMRAGAKKRHTVDRESIRLLRSRIALYCGVSAVIGVELDAIGGQPADKVLLSGAVEELVPSIDSLSGEEARQAPVFGNGIARLGRFDEAELQVRAMHWMRTPVMCLRSWQEWRRCRAGWLPRASRPAKKHLLRWSRDTLRRRICFFDCLSWISAIDFSSKPAMNFRRLSWCTQGCSM